MELPFLYEEFQAKAVDAAMYDSLLAGGWRHFGTNFYRYAVSIHENKLCSVVPLRICLPYFLESKSQRRVLRRNSDLAMSLRAATLDEENTALFELHATRFSENVPVSLEFVLGKNPPRELLELQARLEGRLVAASYIGIGLNSISSIYGIHDPAYPKRSLGLFTLLRENAVARATGKIFHYLGYCYDTPSHYDYKKGFHGLEMYNWSGKWIPLARNAQILCATDGGVLGTAREVPVDLPPHGPVASGAEDFE